MLKPNPKFLTILLLGSISITAIAQNLPKVQQASVRAPETIKIDGEITEWNGQFQAYNRGNYMYYTVSNDDNNLYLTAHVNDMISVRKIFRGGITFTIVPSSKNADGVSVTFPAIKKRADGLAELSGNPIFVYKTLKSDTVVNKAKIDALITSSNNLIRKTYNEIYVKGIPGIPDPFISVYNTQGIKVGVSFDKKLEYTYELAIPLKYLEAATSNAKGFKYNIKLNTDAIVKVKEVPFGPVLVLGPPVGPGSPDDLFLFNDTDFSGEYILAKKDSN